VTGRCFLKKIHLPKHKRLPHALAHEQIRGLLGRIKSPVHRACLLIYACGLRISEAITPEIGAIDRASSTLRVIGKGTGGGAFGCRNRC
jgi:site-specific recombinase XerD